jgi:type II secretory pathway component PulF
MFKEFGGELPASRSSVINALHFFVNNWSFIIVGVVGSIVVRHRLGLPPPAGKFWHHRHACCCRCR